MMNEGNHLVHDITVIGFVPGIAILRRNSKIVPGLFIDTVHTKQFDFAGIDKTGNGVDHSHVLVIEISSAGAGKNHIGFSPVPVNPQSHIVFQVLAPPVVFFNVHVNVFLPNHV